jgi:hypothetical protein
MLIFKFLILTLTLTISAAKSQEPYSKNLISLLFKPFVMQIPLMNPPENMSANNTEITVHHPNSLINRIIYHFPFIKKAKTTTLNPIKNNKDIFKSNKVDRNGEFKILNCDGIRNCFYF